MNRLLVAIACVLACTVTPAVAQKSPHNEGDYVCRNKGNVTGSFSITGPSTYVDSSGNQRSFQYDPGLNVLNFDDGRQYFVGKPDLLILIENGGFTKHGCARQIR